MNLLEAMHRHGVKRLVFSSTCATYGIPATTPIREDFPQNPVNPYGETKLMFERILRDYQTPTLSTRDVVRRNNIGKDRMLAIVRAKGVQERGRHSPTFIFRGRVKKTLAFLETVPAGAVDGSTCTSIGGVSIARSTPIERTVMSSGSPAAFTTMASLRTQPSAMCAAPMQ